MVKLSFQAFNEAAKHVDEPHALRRAQESHEAMMALQLMRPRNWWDAGVSHEVLLQVAREDGIPFAWVPRTELLVALAQAENRDARTAVLLDHEVAIIEDCATALQACTHPWQVGEATLALRALDAYSDGHREAAMALSLSR